MERTINVVEALTKYKQNLIIRDKGQFSDKSVAEHSNLTMKEVIECLDFAIDTMHKYQKIEQIYQEWNEVNDFSYKNAMQMIGEVLEDGSNNN